jgi:tetratricopeptide (TPR) repeat protein
VEAEELLHRALSLGEEGDWAGMARTLLDALRLAPDEPAVHCWLGVAEEEMGLLESAYHRFKEALALEPEDPHILATVGNGLAHFDDPDAEGALRTAALLAPDLPLARWMFGAYLSREGLFDAAMRELSAASGMAPEDPVVAYELGVALVLQNRLEEALDPLTRSVDLDPGEGWGQVVLGLVEAELHRMEEAARDLSEGARHRAEDVEAQLLAALGAETAGWEDLAFEMLERGRLSAGREDLDLLEEVETRMAEGPEAAETFLRQDLLASALRERIMQRP